MLNKFLVTLLLISTLLLLILSFSLPVNNPDTWYHLKVGEHIVNNRLVPKKDFYSFTAFGRGWIAQWWLYDVIVFFLQSRYGFDSLIYLKVIIGILIFVFLYITLKLYRLPNFFIAAFFVLSTLIIKTAWVDRPHIFSYLFEVILMWILISYQFGKKKPLGLIPPLLCFWANIHASIPIALAIIGFLVASEVWKNISRKKPPFTGSYPLLLALFAGTLASLANPNTYKTHLYVFKINPEFTSQNIVEWIPLSSFFEDPYIRLFLIFMFLTLVSFLYALRKPKKDPILNPSLFEIILTVICFYLSLSALRFIPVSTLILLPFMAKNLYLMTNDLWLMTKKRYPARSLAISHYSSIMKLALVFIIFALCFPLLKIPHTGVEVGSLPMMATEFIDKVNPAPNMFHVFNWGGYLIWRLYPKYKVFIDGRLDMYVPDIYQEWLDVVLVKDNWQEILDKYDVNFCLISNEPEWNRLGQALEENPNWLLIFWDDQAGIFVRKVQENEAVIKEYGLDAVTVYNFTTTYKEGKKGEAEAQYKKLFKLCPPCSSSHNKLGVLYYNEGEIEKARSEFEEALKLEPTIYAAPYFNLGLILENEGNYNEAIDFYKKAIKATPQFLESYKKLGLIYSRRLRYKEEAIYYFEKYLKLGPDESGKREAEKELQRLRAAE